MALAVTDVPVDAILTILLVRPLRIIAYMTHVYMASCTIFQDSAQRVRTIVLPNQYCPIIVWENQGWFLGDVILWGTITPSWFTITN